MPYSDDVFLLRKEKIGWIAVIAWIVGFLPHADSISLLHPDLWIPMAYISTLIWLGMDASYRKMNTVGWVILSAFTVPIGIAIYFAVRTPMPVVCYRCGYGTSIHTSQCPNCGYQSYYGRLFSTVRSRFSGSGDSCADLSIDASRKTAGYLALAFGVFALVGGVSDYAPGILVALSAAAYWVLLAYWVNLDAKWRRMDAMPWTALTLLTNLVGFATYLVIRHPEPATCPSCAAPLSAGLKHCPYCGAGIEVVCPTCQAQVRPGWVYCPACATQLPVTDQAGGSSCDEPATKPATVSIRGTVVDTEKCVPVAGAVVKIDSRTITASATTDAVGRFVLVDLDTRPYVLIASAEGYVSQSRPFEPSATQSTMVNFTLSHNPEQ